MKRKLIYPLIAATLAGAFGCSTMQMQRGEEAYSCLAYSDAIRYYTAALKSKEDPEARIRLAHSYMLINDPANAEIHYRKAIEDPETDPIHWLNFAKVLIKNNKHEEAMNWLKTYLEKQPTSKIAQTMYESCKDITALKQTDDVFEVRKLEILGVRSAYAAVPHGKGIVFTGDDLSPEAKRDPWTGNTYFNLYYMERNGSKCKNPYQLKGVVNGTFHEGAATFGNEGSTICFTRSNYHPKKNKLVKNQINESNLKIFFASKNGEQWENLEGFTFNSDDYSVGHPCLSPDGSTLYFVSDMPGGYGGTDIYVSRLNAITDLNGGKWSKPQNLGPQVNTAGNEMFPWFNTTDNTLYFSSDGHRSLGGLDIFMSKQVKDNWTEPKNLGAPINSTMDDFALVMNADGKFGYFSSSREKVDQVYEFWKPDPVFSLTGMITDKMKGTPLANAFINIIDTRTSKTISVRTDASGKYEVALERDVTYRLDIGAENYFAATGDASTMNKTKSEVLRADFSLKEIETEKAIVLENILYDLNKWNIRPDAALELNKLVDMLKQNPTVRIELGSHTDARGNDKANMELSKKRAQSAVDYIVSQGIARDRLIAKGYGETVLVNKCGNGVKCSEEMHQKNRRTEIKILKQDKIASAK